ncbi:MAG: hypothetical protein MSS80_04095 [Mollicutes bacterium]|nr:hypothetical protein [Mollicutes bacterium]
MASTNKTANLKLSQYVNSDRPSYMQDYNEDMLKIDNGFSNINIKETKWLKLPVNEQSYYTDTNTNVSVKRIGNVVYCTGFVNSRRKNEATDYNLFIIPEGYRPARDVQNNFIAFSSVTVINRTSSIYIGSLELNEVARTVGYDHYLSVNGITETPQMSFKFTTCWVTDEDFPEN